MKQLDKKKNIAIIVPRLCDGGAERTAGFVSYQLAVDHNVYLFVFDTKEITYPYKGMLINVGVPASGNWISRILNLLKRIKGVRKLKVKYNIDTSISFMDGADLVNCLTKKNEKVITSIRNHKSNYAPKNILLKQIDKLIYKFVEVKSDIIVAISQGVAKDLIDYYNVSPKKILPIYNSCDIKVLEEESADSGKQKIENSIVTMGRLVGEKGQWHLIRAFTRVREEYPDAILDILGSGPLKDKLQTLIDDLELSDCVRLIGYIKGPHQFIRQHDIFVFPSISEGLGYSLIEALCCGMPCIADDCEYGPREILAPGTEIRGEFEEVELAEVGMLTSKLCDDCFDSETPLSLAEEQLAKAICTLLGNKALRLQYQEAAKKRSYDYLPEKIMEEWRKII